MSTTKHFYSSILYLYGTFADNRNRTTPFVCGIKIVFDYKMPSSSRPRGAASDRGGRPANNIPMSERQQLAIIKQMSVKSDSGKDEPGI